MGSIFEDLVQRICSEQGLIDIAPKGKAQQSSLSRWSRKNDAQRAVTNNIGDVDFAFHTDDTSKSWWSLDFEGTHFPEFIVIENRKRSDFWKVASNISVKASEDGENWITLHEGQLLFGTYQEGAPLVLPIGGVYPIRKLLIENAEGNYLHLRSVKVFTRGIFSPNLDALTFIANRTDGLGERLKALVNSIALAGYFKGDFAFSWKQISNSMSSKHAIGSALDIFSPTFVGRHLSRLSTDIDLKTFLKDHCRKNLGSPEKVAQGLIVDVPQNSIYSFEPELNSAITADDLTQAFWKIGFSDLMQKAIDAAYEVNVPKSSVGLHLRAGDIIFGRYRYNSRYLNKVVPYPLALHFIRSQNSKGSKVVLFGQDEEMCMTFSKNHDVVFAGQYHEQHGFDVYQAALFDIILMSRCSTVVAGNSGFSQIAHIVGQFDTIDPRDLFSPKQALEIILNEIEVPSTSQTAHDLQKAFACSYAVNMLGEEISDKESIRLMQLASKMDTDNAFYDVLLSISYFRSGKKALATSTLEHAAKLEAQRSNFGTLENLIGGKHPDGSYPLDRKIPVLREMSDSGVYPAAGILALLFALKGDMSRAAEYKKVFVDHHPETDCLFSEKVTNLELS